MGGEADSAWAAYMAAALAEADRAAAAGDVPVGAVVVRGGEILAAAHNRRALDADPTAHAEMLAIRAAARRVGDWRLSGCTLVVTLEPCCMCAGAMVLARLDRVVYGAADPKAGAVETLYRLCCDRRLNHQMEVIGGVAAEACGRRLAAFFRRQRELGKK
jgi:tRNA(adenine34) deaminase